jgi:hypothetical protein
MTTVSNTLLTWESIEDIRGYSCNQYPKLKIFLKGETENQHRYWGLFLDEKKPPIRKVDVSWGANYTESQEKFTIIKDEAQKWWNTEYRTRRFNIKIKLWTLSNKIKQSKAKDKDSDYKYIHSIFIRLLMNHGGLTSNEITGLNAIAEKYSIVDLPKIKVNHITDEEYRIRNYIVSVHEDKWKVYFDKKHIYSTDNLDDAFIYVSQKIVDDGDE